MSTTESDESDSDDKSDQKVVKMVFRKPVPTTPISILIESLVKNLCNMIEPNDKRAKQIYDFICNKLCEMKLIDESFHMSEFEGIRSQYQKALYRLVTAARNGEEPVSVQSAWPNENIESEWSHYRREFDEIEYIAGGGFGQVFRVRHKLDGSDYAVKKIIIKANSLENVQNYLAEVKTFASLNHSNIVQYKAAWLELGISNPNKKAIDYCDNFDEDEHHPSNAAYSNLTSVSLPSFKRTSNNSDFTVEFEALKSKHYSYSNDYLPRLSRSRSRKSISEGGQAICKYNFDETRHFESIENKWAILYIQMSLCQITLKQWLEKRNESDLPLDLTETVIIFSKTKIRRETVIAILKQLLSGLQYIHSKNIVHHDFKPSNIFIQIENGKFCVQLGDFGLACPLQNSKHALAFGTKLYAAPEQLAGKCDPKSDMYSLGIVLLELVNNFRTDMERVHNITELRKGRLNSMVSAQDPQLAHIITQLVTNLPQARPSATELLKRLTIPTEESVEIKYLKDQLIEKENEISRLKEKLKNAGIED